MPRSPWERSGLATVEPEALKIVLMQLVGATGLGMIVPTVGIYIYELLGLPPLYLSLYICALTVSTVTLNRYVGRALDRGTNAGRFELLAVAGFAAAVTLLLLGAPMLLLATLGAMLMAMANMHNTVVFACAQRYAQSRRIVPRRFVAIIRAQTSIGWIIGPLLSFLLIYWGGLQWAFAGALGVACAWLLMWRLTFGRQPAFAAAEPVSHDGQLAALPPNRVLALAVAVAACFSAISVVMINTIPLYYRQMPALPDYAPGVSFAIKCATEVPAIFLASALSQRIGEERVLGISAVLAIIAMLAMLMVRDIPTVVLAALVEGLYYGLFAGSAILFFQGLAPDRAGSINGLFVSSQFIGAMVGSVSLGLISQIFGFRANIVLALVLATCALVLLWFVPARRTVVDTRERAADAAGSSAAGDLNAGPAEPDRP